MSDTPPKAQRTRMFNHPRRPPLAEIDSWELWQAWKPGGLGLALPWLGLLASFCVVLAAMSSFFFLSISFRDDTVALVALTFVGIVFAFSLWRRISTRRGFAMAVVALIIVASGLAFSLWLIFYAYTGWNPFAAILGTVLLGL